MAAVTAVDGPRSDAVISGSRDDGNGAIDHLIYMKEGI